MRIFDTTKTIEYKLEELDLSTGSLEYGVIVHHHDAVAEVKEQGHWVTERVYPNGGKDVKWVVDIEGVEAKDAYDENEGIYIFTPYTPEQIERNKLYNELETLEKWFAEHDYIGIKIATGRATIADYAEEIALMNQYAERINEINAILNPQIATEELG